MSYPFAKSNGFTGRYIDLNRHLNIALSGGSRNVVGSREKIMKQENVRKRPSRLPIKNWDSSLTAGGYNCNNSRG